MNAEPATSTPVREGTIGAGSIGSFHGGRSARSAPGAALGPLRDAYTGELARPVDRARDGMGPGRADEKAGSAPEIAPAAIESVQTGRPVRQEKR